VKATDVRVEDVSYSYEDFAYRTPIKFGGTAVDRVTLVNVDCRVRTRAGVAARGFGSMPLGNVWAFPSRVLSYDSTLAAMKALVERVRALSAACTEVGHPIDLTWILEPEYDKAAAEVSGSLALAEPIPRLCTLVAASAFDAALHDAFGKAHGLNCYHTYGPDFLSHDLGHYLGREFAGETLDRYVLREPRPRMPLYHLVGALDPLEAADVRQPVGDGLPETLAEWVPFDGLTHLKIKLNGDDLAWDVERVVRVDRVTAEAQRQRGVSEWWYSLDFNERCPHVGYLLEFLSKAREQAPRGYERVAYIEQPTARDLKAHRDNVMHEAAKLRPVVIDESLLDLESLRLAREMGYTGAALKACKGQSQSLLLAAAAQKYGMFLCVQDLTCPGASLIHSAGLAAHVPGVSAIESNARQYVPAANRPWEGRFPGLFRVSDGTLETGALTGPGLGAVPFV
jgi:L-alanine-DL-glutamate epimerase-like enolase superfamily enzyme